MATRGRPQTVSIQISTNELESIVKKFAHGGGYIPIPEKYAGRKVKIVFVE